MTTLASVLAALPPDPRVVVAGNFATPWRLLAEVDAALPAYRLWMLNAQPGIPIRDGVTLETPFVGAGMRRQPTLRYFPARLSVVPRLFEAGCAPDLVVLHVAPPRGEMLSLGTEVNVLPAAIEQVRRRGGAVVAQVNPHMPYTFGDALVPRSEVDVLVEDDTPLAEPPAVEVGEAAALIGELVARRVQDGATLQAGIGAIPDAALAGLRDRRGLGVWTEMFSDRVLELERAGALDPERPIVSSFVFGTADLYAWLDGNQRVVMRRTEVTNTPGRIALNPQMTSINSALQVDLLAQANASRINARIHSGFGGQTDFIVGALHSVGGQSMIALRSWHPKAQVSTIVPLVDEPVTSFQMHAVITEYGTAEVFGHDERTQARNLIEDAAHPDAREELWEEAHHLGLA